MRLQWHNHSSDMMLFIVILSWHHAIEVFYDIIHCYVIDDDMLVLLWHHPKFEYQSGGFKWRHFLCHPKMPSPGAIMTQPILPTGKSPCKVWSWEVKWCGSICRRQTYNEFIYTVYIRLIFDVLFQKYIFEV